MPKDTRDALGQNAERCDSRSLLLDRFVYSHPDMDEARKLHFAQVCADSFKGGRFAFATELREQWATGLQAAQQKLKREQNPDARRRLEQTVAKLRGFLEDTKGLAQRTSAAEAVVLIEHGKPVLPFADSHFKFVTNLPIAKLLHAQLQSRLMVNMAGGVMENAGLCLDRFGLPYIPGSAVKGCARRAALAALHEWCASGGQPAHKPASPDNPLAPCCAGFATPADMLAAIARTFGWCELDWSDRPDQSDFRWACAELWPTLRQQALALLGNPPPKDFAGSISFLPAYPADLGKTGKVDGFPLDLPPLGKLELDVVTCHHRDYYEDRLQTATDTEEPVPVVFPAVAPGHVFTFALAPLRNINDSSHPSDPSTSPLTFARAALRTGLQTFGLGAKTNAGYGWFADVTEAAKTALERASRKPDDALFKEFRGWDDKKIRATARLFMFQNTKMWPQTGREATENFQFTLVSFILSERKALFDAEKTHAGSDFAKGVKRLAEKFGIAIS
jgi:CRISPR type III-B/RAMP module RAMP protein Cmr6